jgi:hypothetical protein
MARFIITGIEFYLIAVSDRSFKPTASHLNLDDG